MLNSSKCFALLLFLCFVYFDGLAQSQKNPIVIIPGLLGSELINKNTEEKVWFKLSRSKDDDLRLPISANLSENRDNLVPGDVLRQVKVAFFPSQDIYQGLIRNLVINGWVEATWENPKARNAFYVFPYDWRLDNIENAKLLIQKIEFVKWKLKQPNLKFDVIAHSMGGLIARYAVMYGDEDPPPSLKATWKGAKHFRRVFLIGTPNKGSVLAFRALLKGYSILRINFNINLPFLQNLTMFDLFTIQSVYQLLPHENVKWVYDENLDLMEIDLFDSNTWELYGLGIFSEKNLQEEFDLQVAREYLKAVLERARIFQKAVSFDSTNKSTVRFFKIGSNCKKTLGAVLMYREKARWEVLFENKSVSTEDGKKIDARKLRKLLYTQGDGVVTLDSLLGKTVNGSDTYIVCEEHDRLAANPDVQRYILERLR